MNSDKTSDKEGAGATGKILRNRERRLATQRKIQGTQEQQEVKVTDSNGSAGVCLTQINFV